MIKDALNILEESNLFITGSAGSGKSTLAKQIITYYKTLKKRVVVLGSTAISAISIGGQTLHSFFVFNIAQSLEELTYQDKRNIKRVKELHRLLNSVELIVIDEISMVSATTMDMISYRLNKSGFNGKILVVGDFFQLPPVKKNTSTNSLFSHEFYAFESSLWKSLELKILYLKGTRRTKDIKFFNTLEKIRLAKPDSFTFKYLEKLHNNKIDYDASTKLFGRNKEVNETNLFALSKIKEKEKIYHSLSDLYEPKALKKFESWSLNLPIEKDLKLKIGAKIIFTTNQKGEFFNGERGEVIELLDESIIVKKENSKIVEVKSYDFCLSEYRLNKNEDIEELLLATVSQFPLKLAYAVTIHKSQGMSINNLICNIDNIFENSQFYVALSRATDPKNLKIEYKGYDFKEHLLKIIKVSDLVKEFYEEILS